MTTQHGPHATQPTDALLTQQVGAETLVYNERTHQAFCLNPVAAQVWRQFDGVRTVARISVAASSALGTPVTEEAVLFALAELRDHGLIAPEAVSKAAPTRRDLMRQIGAGAIVMLPAVAAIMAPRAAEAYNGYVSGAVPARPGSAGAPVAPRRQSNSADFDFLPPPDFSNSAEDAGKKRRQNGEIFVP